jgi:hypothetical protein
VGTTRRGFNGRQRPVLHSQASLEPQLPPHVLIILHLPFELFNVGIMQHHCILGLQIAVPNMSDNVSLVIALILVPTLYAKIDISAEVAA